MPKIHEVITEETWTKGALHLPNDKGIEAHCIIGWIKTIYNGQSAYLDVYEKLSNALHSMARSRSLLMFNDHPDTTFDDVLRALKVADV